MRPIDADALLKGRQDHEMISTHLIWNAPTIDAEPVRHGRWLDGNRGKHDGTLYWYRYCSECLYERNDDNTDKDTKYCPDCGAKMDGERRTDG